MGPDRGKKDRSVWSGRGGYILNWVGSAASANRESRTGWGSKSGFQNRFSVSVSMSHKTTECVNETDNQAFTFAHRLSGV